MTIHPIDTEALRDAVRDHEPDDHGPGKCDLDDCFTSCVECGEDWPCLWSSLPDLLAAAEAERDEWRQTALDERAAALDALEQIKAREARIKDVRDVLDWPHLDLDGDAVVPANDIRRALDGDA